MLALSLLLLAVFILNIVPAFAPPTWMVMSFFGFRYPDANPFLVALTAAVGATCGRTVLAHGARRIAGSHLISDRMRDSLAVVAETIGRRRVASSTAFLLVAISPLPSNVLFMAYGLARARMWLLVVPFFLGRLFSYTLAFAGAAAVSRRFDVSLSDTAALVYFIAAQIAWLAGLYVFTRVDWRRTQDEHGLRWLK